MDYSILSWINDVFGNSKFLAVLARIISSLGDKWCMVGMVILLLCFKKTRKVGFYVMVAGGCTLIVNNFIIKNIFKRIRPFIEHGELTNMCELAGAELPAEYSMASGHAAVSMAVAVAIMFFSKKWGSIAICSSVIVGISRLVLCVHYPTDVLVGWLLGAALAVGLHFATTLGLKILNSIWGNKNEKISNSNKKSEQN